MYEIKTRVIHDTKGLFSQGEITHKPCSTIVVNSSHYLIEYYLSDTPPHNIMTRHKTQDKKPEYKVLSMPEIEAIPWNGYNVVSTFSGCGGSCLGYRMAGFRVLWANEFIPAAQEVYKINHPNSILDTRDIRKIEPNEILEAIGLNQGEIDVLDGSPPCASFSTAGKREKGWGQVKEYSDTKQRVDDLFFEYARIVEGLQPKVFVAENVSGLVKGKAKGYFKLILARLKDCGYNVKAKVLDAQWLGVPQMRQRVIFIGVRDDLQLMPFFPKPLPYPYSVREAIPWIIQVDLKSHGPNSFDVPEDMISIPALTVGTGPNSSSYYCHSVKGKPTVDPNTVCQNSLTHGNLHTHSERSIPVEPEADISNYAIGKEWDKLKEGEQSDKYFQLQKVDTKLPCPTITQRGGDNTVASITHPTEKRKFTIAELKRICAFPDDFILTGTYAQQWERLGRAVPPVMMAAIAKVIKEEIL